MNCTSASIWKEKLLLNLRMFEAMVISSYIRLCVSTTFDTNKAKILSTELIECYDDILGNFKKLWVTENRETGFEIFNDYIKLKKENVIKLQQNI